jgi:hypothetical protein
MLLTHAVKDNVEMITTVVGEYASLTAELIVVHVLVLNQRLNQMFAPSQATAIRME